MATTKSYSSQSSSSGGSSLSYTKYKPLTKEKKKVTAAEKSYNKAVRKGFNAPYKSQLNNVVGQINGSKFEYDLNKDALYNQYKEQYQAMGNTAMQEAQADATALTGGFANSYAQTAGQRAYNSYVQQLQNIVPQLYSQARQNYDTELSNLYNKANLYSGLNAQSYTEYAAQLDQKNANREYAFNKYSTMKQLSGKQVSKEKNWSKSSQSTKAK